MQKPAIYTMSFASVYPHYVKKAEKNGRTKREVNKIIYWLTGYKSARFHQLLKSKIDMETFFKQALQLNPNRTHITGVICGIRVVEIKEKTMREIRYLDKLIDELAKGKSMQAILRAST